MKIGCYWEIYSNGVCLGTVPDIIKSQYINVLIAAGLVDKNLDASVLEFRYVPIINDHK